MINSLFDRCLIDIPNFDKKEQEKPYFRGLHDKNLSKCCLISKVNV
jgi:hypothetical protein